MFFGFLNCNNLVFYHKLPRILIIVLPKRIAKHINSFDFFKATVVSILIVSPIYWGFSTGHFPLGMSFVVGVLFAYFSNIEGTNRNRILGMILSFLLGFIVLVLSFLVAEVPYLFKIALLAVLFFSISMLSVYGFRGSMIAFSGLFAIVMGLMLHKYGIPFPEILQYVALGGVIYICVSSLSQFLFQTKHIQILLSECMELTATFLKINEDLKWEKESNSLELQNNLLRAQSAINDKHELLRSMLMSEKSRLISSAEDQKLYLIFKELIDLYEIAIAWNPDVEVFEEELKQHVNLLKPFQKISELVAANVLNLSEAIRTNADFLLDNKLNEAIKTAEKNINIYVEAVKLPQAREGALMLRNLLDQERNKIEKFSLIVNIHNNLFQKTTLVTRGNSQFITTQNYSWNTLKSNLTTESVIFRHSIRLSIAFLLSFFIGNAINSDYTNWIIVTTLVILRPNYGLTKSRAQSRMIGTVLGMAITFFLVYFFSNFYVYGIIASATLWLGFSFINKNYKIGSAGITISILLLYVLNETDSLETILNRGLFTFIGVLISLFSMYFVWPVWEKESIKESLIKGLLANLNYLKSVNMLYRSKIEPDTAYRLIRKDAFLKNGNLNGSFQRLQEEPKSKRNQVNTIYATVLLSNSFLSAIAAYSAYIQSHKTTSSSESFDIIMDYIGKNLENCVAILNTTEPIKIQDNCKKSFEILEKKYADLKSIRNKEIAAGIFEISTEKRNQLQEAKSILEQLKWLKNLSENLLDAVSQLELKGRSSAI